MAIDDLKKLVNLADTESVHQSAIAFNISTSALSKSLKKIESQLNCQLFDRVGRNIKLNAQGKKFVLYAKKLVHDYEQMCSEFSDQQSLTNVNIAGPSILVEHVLPELIDTLKGKEAEFTIRNLFEGKAIQSVKSAQSHLAVVTSEALASFEDEFDIIPLTKLTFKVVASVNHPLISKGKNNVHEIVQVLNFPFACPSSSPFCGIERGVGSDGWHDHKYPRKIHYRTDDFNMLISLVKTGKALAYIPDFYLTDDLLTQVNIADFNYDYQEECVMVYKPSVAFGWLNQLAYDLRKT